MEKAKWIALKHAYVKSAWCLIIKLWGYPKTELLFSSSHAWHSNDYLTDSGTVVPWILNHQLGESLWDRGADRQGRRDLHGAPDARVREASKHLNGLANSPESMLLLRCISHASTRMHCEKLFDPVNLFVKPMPSPSWLFRFQGTSVLELVK